VAVKRFITEQTVNRNADKMGVRPSEWLDLRRKELERKIRCRWSVCHVHGSEIGNIPIALIMRAVKWLERNGATLRTVNRMGKGYAFKIRKTGVL